MVVVTINDEAKKAANLRVLQRLDGSIHDIVGSATHVVLYSFNDKNQAWERRNVEGSLFVAKRQPQNVTESRFKLLILNRHSKENLEVPLAASFQMQVREPYLIFRLDDSGGNTNIMGIWFHDSKEREAISKILERVIQSLTHVAELENKEKKSKENKMKPSNETVLAATLQSTLGISGADSDQKDKHNVSSDRNTATEQMDTNNLVLDKKHLKLTLMSLLEDDRFLDIIHAQYLKNLKVANSIGNRKENR